MPGLFITFEGTEGSGKSTQIQRLALHLRSLGHHVLTLREPGGTPIGEEIRHTLQHSHQNHAMCPEAELLLFNASRAQLVHEIIRPTLNQGHVVLCDRFYDSTLAYQAYGRGLNLNHVQRTIDFAVGNTHPNLTLLLRIPIQVSTTRRQQRQSTEPVRDRMEEADQAFFQRVEQGFDTLAQTHPHRIQTIDATSPIETVEQDIRNLVLPLLHQIH
ncbi:MAG: dTMP kinase [Limisphaerales bacterium]